MSKRKLLLADDSATIQKVVNLTFADEGIEVTAVSDGDSALEKFAENPPDLVLADVNIPGIDGYEICDFIKRGETTKHIPVILLVGSFEPFDEEKARSVGADDYMTKPFQSIRQLVTKVSGLLNTAGDAAASDGETKKAAAEDSAAEAPAVEDSAEASHSVSAETDGDAQIDEETVQTNQIGSLPVDEAERFSSALPDEDSSETLSADSTDEADETRMQSLNADETAETDLTDGDDSDEYSSSDEKVYDVADEDIVGERESEDYRTLESDNFSEQSFAAAQSYGRISEPDSTDDSVIGAYEESVNNSPVNPPANPFAGIELDEMNLLELSFDDDDEFYEFEDEPIAEVKLTDDDETAEFASTTEMPDTKVSFTAREFQSESPTEVTVGLQSYEAETTAAAVSENQRSFENISPDLIEAIAARVIEKLSDRAVREVAADIVPQMADSIIREMARDKFNS